MTEAHRAETLLTDTSILRTMKSLGLRGVNFIQFVHLYYGDPYSKDTEICRLGATINEVSLH